MFFPTSMISQMVPFRTFSFFGFLADLLQKSISVASNLFLFKNTTVQTDKYVHIFHTLFSSRLMRFLPE
jgi:hypothetical protein